MGDKILALPRNSYEIIRKILTAYWRLGGSDKSLSLAAIAGAVVTNPTVVSRNHAFLLSIGLIEREGTGYHLTPLGTRVSQALDYGDREHLAEGLREAIIDNELLRRILTAVRIRGGMDESSLVNHVALTAGVPKKPEFLSGAKAVVDMMAEAGVLKDEGGLWMAVDVPGDARRQDTRPPGPASGTSPVTTLAQLDAGNVRIAVQITVTGADLYDDDRLQRIANQVTKLRKHLEKLAPSPEE